MSNPDPSDVGQFFVKKNLNGMGGPHYLRIAEPKLSKKVKVKKKLSVSYLAAL